MRSLFSSLVFSIALFYTAGAWSAISSAAWKVIFSSMAHNGELIPSKIGRLGVLLKKAESNEMLVRESDVEDIVNYLGVTSNNEIKKKMAEEFGVIDEETVDQLAGFFAHFQSLKMLDWIETLTELESKGIFSTRDIGQLEELREKFWDKKRLLMLGRTPTLGEEVAQAKEKISIFSTLNLDDRIEVLLKTSGLEKSDTQKIRKILLLKNNGVDWQTFTYAMLLKLSIFQKMLGDREFDKWVLEVMPRFFDEKPAKWVRELKNNTFQSFPLDERNLNFELFNIARDAQSKEDLLLVAYITGVSVAIVTSPLWYFYIFHK